MITLTFHSDALICFQWSGVATVGDGSTILVLLAQKGRRIIPLKLRGKGIEKCTDFPGPLFQNPSKWMSVSKAKCGSHTSLVLMALTLNKQTLLTVKALDDSRIIGLINNSNLPCLFSE